MKLIFLTSDDIRIFDVDLIERFKFQYKQKIDYSKNLNSKTIVYNYGPLADKWVTEITIQDTVSNMALYSQYLSDDNAGLFIELNESEKIFGAGIDYTYGIQCNIINATREYSQENIALSQLKLTLEAISYNGGGNNQLKYRDAIPAGLPSRLNFQTPVDKSIIKRESAYQSENFGEYGKIFEKNGSIVSFNEEISLVFNQTEEEASQIEKFVNTQRSAPFVFSEADYIYLFKDQSINNVIITGLVSTRVSHDNWVITLKLVTNV